jgi:hypothetical protein
MAFRLRTQSARIPRRPLPAYKLLFGRTGYFPARTGRRRGTRARQDPIPPPPPEWRGTLPEWRIYAAFLLLGLRDGEDFVYLYDFGLPDDPVNQVDFFVPAILLAIEIQGLYWHYVFGGFQPTNDRERRVYLESLGYTVVFIDEDAAIRDPVYYLREALQGRDHSRFAQGGVG